MNSPPVPSPASVHSDAFYISGDSATKSIRGRRQSGQINCPPADGAAIIYGHSAVSRPRGGKVRSIVARSTSGPSCGILAVPKHRLRGRAPDAQPGGD